MKRRCSGRRRRPCCWPWPRAAVARPTGGAGRHRPDETLTVFAAASLKTTFTTLGEQFESSHPGSR